MNTLNVGGIAVEVVRKRVKNVNIRVYRPDGRVRVSAPLRSDDAAVRRAIVSRLGWIRRKRRSVEGAVRPAMPGLAGGEVHLVQGRGYVLDVVEGGGGHRVCITNDARLELRVRRGTNIAGRWRALDRFYRELLERRVPELLEHWQARMGVTASEWRIKSMKTRWGTCNIRAKRIWLNVELARRPERCLEYVLVHELTHLFERNHNKRFYALMDEFLPDWRSRRDELNTAPPGG